MQSTRSLLKIKPLFRSCHNFSSVAAVQTGICENLRNSLQTVRMQEINIKRYESKTPKVICHRGRCDLYPENTIESIMEGLPTSDLVEFDIMLTKDEEVIVFHDRFLGEITNIGTLPEFQDRKTVNDLNQFGQIPHEQWWVKEFNLEELKKLCVKQKHQTRPQIMERHFHIPTLDEVLSKVRQFNRNRKDGKKSGLLIEIKTERQNFEACERDIILLQKISSILKRHGLENSQTSQFPIIIQSFNHQVINRFHKISPKVPLTHLYYDEDLNVNQEYLSKHRTASSVGVAVSKNHLKKQLIEICHRMKYQVFYWSVRDDEPEIPFGCSSYAEFYNHLRLSNVDGIITDFADNCKNAISQINF